MKLRAPLCALAAIAMAGCARPPASARPRITVAAAANLGGVFRQIGSAFSAAAGAEVVFSFASTGDLARQIENAAPFDVFAAADTEHVAALDREGLLAPGTRHVYARGRLALWTPPARAALHGVEDLAEPGVRFVAVANPRIAPYGRAAVETLKAAGLWTAVEPKIVYAENVNMSKQYALTGNADASFTAWSLVIHDGGSAVLIDEKLHQPIEQALAVTKSSQHPELARRFVAFVLGAAGRAALESNGYLGPDRAASRSAEAIIIAP